MYSNKPVLYHVVLAVWLCQSWLATPSRAAAAATLLAVLSTDQYSHLLACYLLQSNKNIC